MRPARLADQEPKNTLRSWRQDGSVTPPAGAKTLPCSPVRARMSKIDRDVRMAREFRVFLSAVTSEFVTARDARANDLQARGLQLRVRRSFRQEPGADTLLRLLHDYIRECSAVVCVIGERSGTRPSAAAATPFVHLLPMGITEASFTQWEFFFARAYERRLSLYLPPQIIRRNGTRRAATIFPNCSRPSSRTSMRRGCITPRFPTVTSCVPRCSRSPDHAPSRSCFLMPASGTFSRAARRFCAGCARA